MEAHFFPFLPPPANRPSPNPLLPLSLAAATTGAVLAATCPAIPLPGLDADPASSSPGPPALSAALPAAIGSFSGTGGGDDAARPR